MSSAAKSVFTVCAWEALSFHIRCRMLEQNLVSNLFVIAQISLPNFQRELRKSTVWARKMKTTPEYRFHISASYIRKTHNRVQKVQFKMGGWRGFGGKTKLDRVKKSWAENWAKSRDGEKVACRHRQLVELDQDELPGWRCVRCDWEGRPTGQASDWRSEEVFSSSTKKSLGVVPGVNHEVWLASLPTG